MANSDRKFNFSSDNLQDPLGYDDSGEYISHDIIRTRRKPRLRRKSRRLVRIEQLSRELELAGEDFDKDAVVSLYLPMRRIRRFGAALLRLDRLYSILLGALLILAIIFIMAFTQEKMGNFTINLNRLEMYRKGISISTDPNFKLATSKLVADAVIDATNISISDLPDNLDMVDGSHNGKNYMAYTYYLRNAGKEDLAYKASIKLQNCTKGAENAARVAVWRNGESCVYAAPAADASPEPGCVSFEGGNVVCTYTEDNFLVGYVDKYTVVIWLEGDDPDCIDRIVGGSIQMTMVIDSDDDDDTSLLVKFIRDIRDMLSGDKPIFASSDHDVPDYYSDEEVTWENRRNQ